MPNKKINALDVRVATATDLMLVGDPTTGTAYKSTLATLPLVPTSRVLTINGVAFDLSQNRSWTIDALPSQAGNSGKYLTTNGTVASWGVIDLSAYVPTSRTLTINGVTFDLSANRSWTISSGTVTSVGLSMPSAFTVANSPITSSGTLAVTANGTAAQYIRGDGQLATLPSGSSGGSSVAYYLNGSVAASVATYYQMSKTPIIGAGTDFSKAGNGLISQFLTDVADPNRLEIPAGNWNFEMYMSASSSGGTPAFYVELLKYNGTTFTSIASSAAIPEAITSGTIIDLYLTSLSIPQTTLLATDRLAIRVYIVNSTGGRTITMHTENSHLCEIITNFAGGIAALNGLTANTQYFATGTSGTDFAISSLSDTHTFNLPTASATNRGALSSADWSTFNGKASGNIYTADGTLTGNRVVTMGANTLSFFGSNFVSVTHDNTRTLSFQVSNNGSFIQSFSNFGTSAKGKMLLNWDGGQVIIGGLTTENSNNNVKIYNGFEVEAGNNQSLLFTNSNSSDPTLNLRRAVSNANNGVGYKFSLHNSLGNFVEYASIYGSVGTNTAGSHSGYLSFFTTTSGTSTEKARFTAAGRLLLGTTTESTFILDVNGTARVSGDVNFGSSAQMIIGNSSPNAFINVSGAGWNFELRRGGTTFYKLWGNGQHVFTDNTQITTQTPSSVFAINSTSQGFLPPRMTSTQKNAIGTPAQGLMVFDTTLVKLCVYNGTAWETITSL